MTFNIVMDFGDEEPVTFIVDAIDEAQAIFIAATMMGSPKVLTEIAIRGNMHLDVRPLAANFNETFPKVTVVTVEE